MTSLFRSRRDADELHDALTGAAGTDVAERHADLLRTVSLLTAHPPVAPRPDFSASLRERLMAAAETELVAAPAPERRTTPVAAPSASPARRRLATVVASLVVVGGTAGMAAAAQDALPGDPLYPIKRGGEALVATDLEQATARLDEAVALQQRGADTALVARTLDEFRSSGEQGAAEKFADYAESGDPAAVEDVRDFTADAMPRLDDLARSDADLESTLVQTADALDALDTEARRLCPVCGPTAAVSLPASLTEGAAAASLASLLVAPAQQARLDADALSGLDPAQVRELGRAAESRADETPVLPSGGTWPVVTDSPRGPVGSTLITTTTDTLGTTVRQTTDAVDGIVGGITGTVGSIVPRDTALGGTVGGLTDTVDETLDGLTGLGR